MDPDQLCERDKRGAAMHEAAHLVVAVASGLRANAWLERTNTSDPLTEKEWTGMTGLRGDEAAIAAARPVIAVAGMVAELFLVNDSDPDPIEIVEYAECDENAMSATDWLALGNDAISPAVASAVKLLQENRNFLKWAAEHLYEHETITDGMAHDFYHGRTY